MAKESKSATPSPNPTDPEHESAAAAGAAEGGSAAPEAHVEHRDTLSSKVGDVRDAAVSLASSARDRAASADVGEIAASTSSLIDTARPFFLATFAAAFTVLGFLETGAGASQLYVLGAILFVLTAGFSHEIDLLMSRRRPTR